MRDETGLIISLVRLQLAMMGPTDKLIIYKASAGTVGSVSLK